MGESTATYPENKPKFLDLTYREAKFLSIMTRGELRRSVMPTATDFLEKLSDKLHAHEKMLLNEG